MQVFKTKTYILPEQKTDTTAQLDKKVPPAHTQRVYLVSVRLSFCPSVRAKRGIWSKRVFMRMNGNLSSSMH